MSKTDTLMILQSMMTMLGKPGTIKKIHPGAQKAFTELYREYGFPGIRAMYKEGYKTPEKVWEFYNSCNNSVLKMALRLKLD